MSVAASILFEFQRTRRLGERTLERLEDADWHWKPDDEANSIAIVIQHMAGNMKSRWSEFRTTDGEKKSRQRDREFEDQGHSINELRALWDEGWGVCLEAVSSVTDDELDTNVEIRGEPLTILQALLRQVSHYSYHVGQIVGIARQLRGPAFGTLTIARGKSTEHVEGRYLNRGEKQ